MVQCYHCRAKIYHSAVKVEVDGRQHYFHTHHVKYIYIADESENGYLHKFFSAPRRLLQNILLNKTFAELIAIGAGFGGIIYTLIDLTSRAIFLDAISFVAALIALLMGMEHIRFLQKRFLLSRIILSAAIGVMVTMVLVVWHFIAS